MADLGKVTGTITSLEMVGGTGGRYRLGCAVRRYGLLCEHLDRVPGVLRGYARVCASEPIAAKLRASVAGE